MKQLPDDFRELLRLLNDHEVEYLVVGGWALGVYGYIRATGDMDIWVGLHTGNLTKLVSALVDFGIPGPINAGFFAEKGNVFRMGRPPIKIEIITEASGIDFDESYPQRKDIVVDGINLPFIGYDDLVKNKRSTGRLKDLADLEGLGEDPLL